MKSDFDISLLTFNRIGREAFGRYWVSKGLPDIYLMEEMGIPLETIIHFACRPTEQQRATRMNELLTRENGDSKPQPEEDDKLSTIRELLNDLSKDELVQLLTERLAT